MSLIKYLDRTIRINKLIHLRATGNPEEFARKLGICRSSLFQALQEMRVIGVDIRYSEKLRSYYYADNRRIKINVESIISKEYTPERAQ